MESMHSIQNEISQDKGVDIVLENYECYFMK